MVTTPLNDSGKVYFITTGLLLVIIQLEIIITFGGGWSHSKVVSDIGAAPVFSTLVPFPSRAPGWFVYVAVNQIFALIVCCAYILFLAAQSVVPEYVNLGMARSVMVNLACSAAFTLLLFLALIVYAASLNGNAYHKLGHITFGYCFWLCVVTAIVALGTTITAAANVVLNLRK